MTVALVILLIVVGLGLLAVELFVIPGFGLIGLLGLAFAVGSVVLAVAALTPTWAITALAGGVVLGGILAWLIPRAGLTRGLVLDDAVRGQHTGGDTSLAALVGAEGVTSTPLRPSGTARIDDRAVDVISDGIYVEAGARVRVTRVDGSRVLVEPITSS